MNVWFLVFLYMLYYMVSRWDGSKGFKLALGIPISVLIVFYMFWKAERAFGFLCNNPFVT